MIVPRVVPRWCWSTDPRGSSKVSPDDGAMSSQLSELPTHLWCWLGRHGDISDFGAVLCCSATLSRTLSFEALWHYHAFSSGYARPAVRADVDWIYPFVPEVPMDRCIDWKRFLHMSCETRHFPSIWVRICDIDIRLPLPPASVQNSVSVVLAEIGRLTRLVGKNSAFGPNGSIANAERRFRLRLLQWAGRPGPVMQGTIMAGDHLLLEWISNGDDRWPLPPHTLTALSPAPLPPQPRSPGSSLFNAWRRRFHAASPVQLGPAGDYRSQGCEVLVRVNAAVRRGPPLVRGELWVLLDLTSATVHCLYESLVELLRRESPSNDKLSEHLELHLMDCRIPDRKATYPETTLLREICWTHCETLNLEWKSEALDKDQIYIWREQQMMTAEKQTPATDGVALFDEENESAKNLVSAAMPRTNMWWIDEEMAVPPPQCSRENSASSTKLEDAETECVCSPTNILRQMQQPGPDAEPPSRSARGGDWHRAVTGHPGDTAVESEEEHSSGPTNEAANGIVWERLAPHYKPKLLVNTHQTRQFEFHPSLPQVLLTGDKKGGVNVIHTEEEKLRKPLVVDSCPVLGLAWMSHHPQSAVCGAAHSGQINFLKYDPQANPQEPVLQHVLKVDEFPKLSSLSINCTDDFLLVSGFTHDLALYDTGTGQVLHRVLEAHNHFINISRFARRAPHIFATASFDHTCKLWDIRQPLTHDRAIKVLHTGGLNVMCTFSPDDQYLLCSGIDTNITQFELPSYRKSPDSFHLRAAMHHARYRRATYFATGRHFVTAATDESHIRIMSSSGRNMGVIDFCGILGRSAANIHRPLPRTEVRRPFNIPRRLRIRDIFESKPQRAERREEPQVMWEAGSLVQGEVQLDDELACIEGRTCKEYVQSVRTHPIVENRVGVLLSSTPPEPQSYIAFVHLDPNHSKED
mmetsp:Transcript_79053/g.144605  ORF Transcript_79053/g.144605 Transcript_79053/m.144605 type:complete len:921 (-) Transcript_79053:200-2962(-)